MNKVSITVSLDKDIADWLSQQPNRSVVVNAVMRQHLEDRRTDTPEYIDQRIAEIKKEFEQLKAKKKELIESE